MKGCSTECSKVRSILQLGVSLQLGPTVFLYDGFRAHFEYAPVLSTKNILASKKISTKALLLLVLACMHLILVECG